MLGTQCPALERGRRASVARRDVFCDRRPLVTASGGPRSGPAGNGSRMAKKNLFPGNDLVLILNEFSFRQLRGCLEGERQGPRMTGGPKA
jgi:hypothetical protein